MPTIKIQIRNIYGDEKFYPICDTAKALARLAGTKTITPGAYEIIKSLGYSVELVTAPNTFKL